MIKFISIIGKCVIVVDNMMVGYDNGYGVFFICYVYCMYGFRVFYGVGYVGIVGCVIVFYFI